MTKRRNAALAVLALAAAAVFVLPASSASAGTSVQSNACANSVTANFSQIEVTTSGDDGLTHVGSGGATTTSGLSQQAAIPGAIFVAGYNLGLLVVGPNNIPANVRTTIEATNTAAPSVQNTNVVGGTPPNGTVTVSTVITDPDGTPGTGDESATDASFSVSYNNLNWTAGASGTIQYRQESIPTAPPTAASNSLLINALVGGVFNVQFRCAPGIVTGMNPGVITLTDPAASFDTTQIDNPPTANAGADQTVDENTLVTLDGSASSDPDGEAVTHNWTQVSGPSVTLSGANTANPTFTAPDVTAPTDLVFQDEVCDAANPDVLCATDTVTVTVNPVVVDTPPTANAGPDQTVNENTLVQLNGSGTDPENEALTFSWTAPAGITLSDPNIANPTFTAPEVAANTPFAFVLQVCDAGPTVLCDTDTVVINVLNVVIDLPPISNAGPDQTVDSGATVTLNGTGSSDPNGEALTYMWSQTGGPAVTLSDATSPTPTFTAPTLAPGDPPATLTFSLDVCDEAPVLCSDPDDTVVITVNPPGDNPPTANAGADQTVFENTLVTLAGSGSDPDGEAVTFAWTQTGGPAVTLSDPTSPTPTFTAPNVAADTDLTFSLQVCDEANPAQLCATDTVVITVQPIPVTDASGIVIVNGPVSSTKTSKSFVFKVTNTGMTTITINETNITSSVDVNGTPTGAVAVNPFTKTLGPGASTRVKLVWSYAAGSLATGDAVVFHACVVVAGDTDPANDCDDQSATAK
jgi:K319L-like, PKD domain